MELSFPAYSKSVGYTLPLRNRHSDIPIYFPDLFPMDQENNDIGNTGQQGDGVPNRPNERADSEVSAAIKEYVTCRIQRAALQEDA